MRTVRIESNASKVRSLALSPNEETLLCALENNQIFVLSLTSAETEDMKIDLLSQVSLSRHSPLRLAVHTS